MAKGAAVRGIESSVGTGRSELAKAGAIGVR